MLRTVSVIAFAAMIATPALAGVTTIEFKSSDGETTTGVYDDSTSTYTINDSTEAIPYTWDAEAKKLCGKDADGADACATFEAEISEVGQSTTFTSQDGESGTATIISVE